MNGEVAQMSQIVISARKALCTGRDLSYRLDGYVLSIRFIFFPRERNVKKVGEADSVSGWFSQCRELGLEDIKFMIPTAVKDRSILGFSNASQGYVLCFWRDGAASCFFPRWTFDRERRGWNVVYQEQEWKNPPEGKPSFVNRTEEFKQVLLDIEKLANEIDAENFAGIFHKAYEMLCGDSPAAGILDSLDVPDAFSGLYAAVNEADVFGAMGSWNDSPPYCAHQKGLDREYEALSDRLLELLRYQLMYAANECWNKGDI